ncbi:MAG: YnbE family lipoprotein [Parvibaculum sp.]|nr:YnbE family lipoprotein [Parvibaculum sp.]
MQPIFFRFALFTALGISFLLPGCNPTVKIEAPDKPIEINLNVKIEQEVRVRVERDLDELLAENPDLF